MSAVEVTVTIKVGGQVIQHDSLIDTSLGATMAGRVWKAFKVDPETQGDASGAWVGYGNGGEVAQEDTRTAGERSLDHTLDLIATVRKQSPAEPKQQGFIPSNKTDFLTGAGVPDTFTFGSEQPSQGPVGTVRELFTQAAWEKLDVRGSTSLNGVDVPERISIPRDEWRKLYAALYDQEYHNDPLPSACIRAGVDYPTYLKIKAYLPDTSDLATSRALKEDEYAKIETPYQIGARLAREGKGISDLWGAVDKDAIMYEAQRWYTETLAQLAPPPPEPPRARRITEGVCIHKDESNNTSVKTSWFSALKNSLLSKCAPAEDGVCEKLECPNHPSAGLCDECETVTHCLKNGCIPKQNERN